MIYFSLPMYNYVLKANKPPSYSKSLIITYYPYTLSIFPLIFIQDEYSLIFIHPKSHKKAGCPIT